MDAIRIGLICCLVALAAGRVCSTHAEQIDGAEVLQKLRAFDAAHLTNVTFEGTEVIPPSILSRGHSPTTMKTTMTIQGDRCAILQETVELPKIRFVPQRPEDRAEVLRGHLPVFDTAAGAVSHDLEGNVIASVTTRQAFFLGDEYDAWFAETRGVTVQPNGQMKLMGPASVHPTVRIYPPGSVELTTMRNRRVWALGRGFSEYINEVTRVERRSDGLLAVTAVGRTSDVDLGTWELTVSPADAYLVREANFTSRGRTKPMFVVSNTGLRRVGSGCFAENGTRAFAQFPRTKANVQYDSIRPEADEALLAAVEKLVGGPHRAGTYILDERVRPLFFHKVARGVSSLSAEFIRSLTTTQSATPTTTTKKASATSQPRRSARPRGRDRPNW